MSETKVEETTQTATATPDTETLVVKNEDEKQTSSNLVKYFIYGLCVVIIVMACYYAYQQFVENQDKPDAFVKGLTQERDDPVMDYNLHEAIDDLEKKQQAILQTLSQDSGL